MTVEELRARLTKYMMNDLTLRSPLVAVEVRLKATDNTRCRYEVLLIDEDGQETEVKFPDRCSRLIYIYALLHPQGFQRRKAAANDYLALRQLYSKLYFRDDAALLKTIRSTDEKRPGQFFCHYVTQSRRAIRETSPLAMPFAIDRPQRNNSLLLIPFVAEGGTVILDSSLSNNMSNL